MGKRATTGDLEAVAAPEGRIILRMADDIHVESNLAGISAVAVHRRSWTPTVSVSFHLDPRFAPKRSELEEALGEKGRIQPRSLDQSDERDFAYPTPTDWEVPESAVVTLTVDGDDRVRAIALEVPVS